MKIGRPSSEMESAFADVLRENALVHPGAKVLIGLSGGGDSVALLHLFRSLASEWSLDLRAAHLDHGIRPESHRDVRFVKSLCREWSVPLDVCRCDVPELAARSRAGVEAAGRFERRRFLSRVASETNCSVIALGHHRNDQAETVLHRMLRGTGVSGLAAMRLQSGPWIRPLLPFSREQILDYLADRDIPFLEDPSNADPAYTRNRIRHQLLPLARTFNPRIEESLLRLSRQIAEEEEFWDQETGRLLKKCARPVGGGLVLDRAQLRGLHPAVRRRLLRRALAEVRGDLLQISADHLLDVEAFLLAGRPQGELHLPQAWVGRRYQDILLRGSPLPHPPPFHFSLPEPGTYSLPGERHLRVSVSNASRGEKKFMVEFDAAAVKFPLTVRNFAPGDRFHPSGSAGSKKLKDFFIDQKVDRWTRREIPLVFSNELLWVVGMRRCEGLRPVPDGPVLQLRLIPGKSAPARQ